MPPRLFAPPDATRLPLALPPAVPDPSPPGFPILAAVAPVAGAVVLWLVTGSMLSLGLAVLGPLLAIATLFDGRRQARRSRRRARVEREAAFDRLRAEVVVRHGVEREAARGRHPSSAALVAGGDAPTWREERPGPVVLGAAAVESALRIEGAPVDDLDRKALDHARRLEHAPVVVDLADGIGFAGPAVLVHAAARAVLVQCAHTVRPDAVSFETPGTPEWRWVEHLPHVGSGARVVVADLTGPHVPAPPVVPPTIGGTSACTIALAGEPEHLPPGLACVVRIDGPRSATLLRRGAVLGTALEPDLIGEAEASAWSVEARRIAVRAGLGLRSSELPALVGVRDLPTIDSPHCGRSTLRAPVGATADGVLELDLVSDGPHAIVAGTSGSGKSEFLLAWILQMAAVHPPERVSFLLVDFKGGAAFEPVAGLPHVAGIVTDLDDAEAERAVQSLTAELRHRERALRLANVRDIADLPDETELARLVVVVDEFQAMIQRFRDLGQVVADIASRGRSLGVHLVLASQRPNGVLGEQVTANAPVRVSLRVMTRADSVAVVGIDTAAGIPADRPGRGVVDRGDGVAVPFQSALVDAEAVDAVRRRFAHAGPVRRPWTDPLPSSLPPAELAAARLAAADPSDASVASFAPVRAKAAQGAGQAVPTVVFGLLDEPDLQRRSLAGWTAADDGHLLVLGMPGSGRSTALGSIESGLRAIGGAASSVLRLGNDAPSDWHLLADLVVAARAGTFRPGVLVVDDLDTCLLAWPDEYRHAAVAMLGELMRDGRRRGFAVAASAVLAHRLSGGLGDLFGAVVHLRHPSRSELAHAGGAGDLWQRDCPPGAGQWRGRRLQVVDASPLGPRTGGVDAPARAQLDRPLVAIVSSTAARDLDGLRSAGLPATRLLAGGERDVLAARAPDAPLLVVGDADAWAASYGLAARMRESGTIVVRGGLREFRALAPAAAGRTGSIALPPLLADDGRECWVIEPGEVAVRRSWPTTETLAYHVERH
ncbi:DNA segregation ATPase FtsK/SpoIIIE, S-DNA-T family [Agromyces sp. CF514]|uniref:FtsK/SpoIIIE domain-containing protein n=1 Tax=Agromyces sp. CF514 TaxID=1881031 RepID=UPI0008E6A0C2|nr:FtsK/SpoIIIE domain-containing protein [Agromyces sp. CF514]SFR87400.1 DNA segregation ATPase FtsK/SpoIIIE, S-DNA-T family [Agromyces sp. CF514]